MVSPVSHPVRFDRLKRRCIIGAKTLAARGLPAAGGAAPDRFLTGEKREERDEQEEKEEREPGHPEEDAHDEGSSQQEYAEFPGFHTTSSGLWI